MHHGHVRVEGGDGEHGLAVVGGSDRHDVRVRPGEVALEVAADGEERQPGGACHVPADHPEVAVLFHLEGSRVRQLKQLPINFTLLTELNTYPRTSYLAKLRNPNRELPLAPLPGEAGEEAKE